MAIKLEPKRCSCGCGGICKGNWIPGHDQKLRAAIESEVGGLIELRRIVEELLHKRIDFDPANAYTINKQSQRKYNH